MIKYTRNHRPMVQVKYTRNYRSMVQVYNKMHEEVHELANQVLELDKLKHQLCGSVLYDVQILAYAWHVRSVGLDWLVRLLNDKKFLESVFMWLYGYMEDEDAYYARLEYKDKEHDYVHQFDYYKYLVTNRILPL